MQSACSILGRLLQVVVSFSHACIILVGLIRGAILVCNSFHPMMLFVLESISTQLAGRCSCLRWCACVIVKISPTDEVFRSFQFYENCVRLISEYIAPRTSIGGGHYCLTARCGISPLLSVRQQVCSSPQNPARVTKIRPKNKMPSPARLPLHYLLLRVLTHLPNFQ